MDNVCRWSLLFVVMATALNTLSTSSEDPEMERLLAREELNIRHIKTRSDCPVSWQKLSSTRSVGGRKMPDTDSVVRCLNRCAVVDQCLGVDVDLRSEPIIKCWQHVSSDDFDKHRSYRVYGFNQYIKEDGC